MSGNVQLDVTFSQQAGFSPEAVKSIAEHYFRSAGVFSYQAFDYINGTFFDGRLPYPLIVWGLTNYGKALGWVRSPNEFPPLINVHPATVFPAARKLPIGPWEIPLKWLGANYAYDIILHESIHISVNYLLGGWEDTPGAESCHNNLTWINEVNRIAPMLGIPGFVAGMAKPKRVPHPGGGTTKTGKPKTVVKRVCTATFNGRPVEDFGVVAGFPHALRDLAGTAEEFYTRGKLPFRHALEKRNG